MTVTDVVMPSCILQLQELSCGSFNSVKANNIKSYIDSNDGESLSSVTGLKQTKTALFFPQPQKH